MQALSEDLLASNDFFDEDDDDDNWTAFSCPACSRRMIWVYDDEPQKGMKKCSFCGASVKYWQTEWDPVRDEDVPGLEFALVDNNAHAADEEPRRIHGR